MRRPDLRDLGLERGLLRGIAVFRVIACAWAVVGVAVSTGDLAHPIVGWILLGSIAAATVVLGRLDLQAPHLALAPAVVAFELALGAIVLVGDGLVFEATRQQSLPWAWPAAGVMTAGVGYGKRAGLVAAVWVAAASMIGEGRLRGGTDWGVAVGSKIGLFLLVGIVGGYVAGQLRLADRTLAEARARDDVSRTLHDGVLQTLAVIQRRSPETELAQLARSQEVDLRAFLAGAGDADVTALGLEAELRTRAARVVASHAAPINVVVAPDLGSVRTEAQTAIVGAAGEAMVNAAKHARATRIAVYAEPSDGGGVYVSVSDDGIGFDPATASTGMGITGSIRGRLEDIGGRCEITSRPGHGTEVQLWVP